MRPPSCQWCTLVQRKRLASSLSLSVDLFATAADFCEKSGAPYGIENPVSTISTYWRKPDFSFHPWWYAGHEANDNYTKTTNVWAGNGFVMPEKYTDLFSGDPDDRIHKCPPGPDRANVRSATPRGFCRAVFECNREDRGGAGPCAKQTVTATVVALNGKHYVGTNYCNTPQAICPRAGLPTGQGYELCSSICHQPAHAEVNAIKAAGEDAWEADLYLEGHTYACAACQQAADAAGVRSIVIGKPPVPCEDLFI